MTPSQGSERESPFFQYKTFYLCLPAVLTFARHSGRGPDISVFAFATETTRRINADGKRSARLSFAFIDVRARGSLSNESRLAKTLTFDAFGVVGAIVIRLAEYVHVYLFASNLRRRFGRISLRAYAIVARFGVFANRVCSARLVRHLAFVDILEKYIIDIKKRKRTYRINRNRSV